MDSTNITKATNDDENAIEYPKTKAPEPAYGHWYHGDLTLEQAQELFPLGSTVRFFRGGGRLLGGMTGKVVGHYQDKDAVETRFGGRAGIKVDIGAGAGAAAAAIENAIGASLGRRFPVQLVDGPFNSCEVIDRG